MELKVTTKRFKMPVAQEMTIGKINIPNLDKFASIFDGALSLKIGDGSRVTMGKSSMLGEVMSRFYISN